LDVGWLKRRAVFRLSVRRAGVDFLLPIIGSKAALSQWDPTADVRQLARPAFLSIAKNEIAARQPTASK
jgi:hypothetical protein